MGCLRDRRREDRETEIAVTQVVGCHDELSRYTRRWPVWAAGRTVAGRRDKTRIDGTIQAGDEVPVRLLAGRAPPQAHRKKHESKLLDGAPIDEGCLRGKWRARTSEKW